MVSRATHYSNQAKHSQRQFGQQKAKLVSVDQGTAWISPMVERLQPLPVGLYFNLEQVQFVAPATVEQLRELSRRGILHMRSLRDENQKFVEFQWALTKAGAIS